MDVHLWSAVKGVRGEEPGAVEQFVHLTLPRLLGAIEGDRQRLEEVYSAIVPRLYSLKAGDDFWSWVEQQFPGESFSAEGGEPDRALVESVEAVVRTASARRPAFPTLLDLPAKLILSGLVPATLVTAVLFLLDERERLTGRITDSTFEFLVKLTLVSLFWGAVFSGVFSPFLSTWRVQLRKRTPALIGPATGLMLLFLMPLFLAGLFEAMLPLYRGGFVLRLVNYTRELSFTHIFSHYRTDIWFSIGLAVGLSLWPICSWAGRRRWVVNRASSRWRKVLSLALLVPIAWQAGNLAWIYHDGRRMEPGLVALLEQERKSQPESSYFRDADDATMTLYDAFVRDPRVEAYLSQPQDPSPELVTQAAQAWLDVGRELWEKENWAEDPTFKALVRTGLFHSPVAQPTAPYLEVMIRHRFATNSPMEVGVTQLASAALTPQEWTSLVGLLKELVARKTASVSQPRVPRVLMSEAGSRVNPRHLESDPPWFWRTRIHLFNQAWRTVQDPPPLLETGGILTPAEYGAVLEEESLHLLLGPTIGAQHEAHLDALALMIAELKLAAAKGEPIPPEQELVRQTPVLKPYLPWIRYSQSGEKVHVELIPTATRNTIAVSFPVR